MMGAGRVPHGCTRYTVAAFLGEFLVRACVREQTERAHARISVGFCWILSDCVELLIGD